MGHGLGLASVLNPLINPDTGTPFSAHNDFVRFFFESGVLGLLCYVMYGVYMTRWIMKVVERNRNAQQAPLGPALAAVWIGLFFLTGGAVELSVQTALLFQTYALAAVISSKHGQTSRPLSHERTQMPTPQ
jgi:O-antigen ligase